jgi:hypothetical protein
MLAETIKWRARTAVRLSGKQKSAEEATVTGDDPVAELDHPDERRESTDASQILITNQTQHTETRPASRQNRPIWRNDVHCSDTTLRQGISHRRPWCLLVGHGPNPASCVAALDPSDHSPAEASPTIPEKPILGGWRSRRRMEGYSNLICFFLVHV